jgi:hypothetical protein
MKQQTLRQALYFRSSDHYTNFLQAMMKPDGGLCPRMKQTLKGKLIDRSWAVDVRNDLKSQILSKYVRQITA